MPVPGRKPKRPNKAELEAAALEQQLTMDALHFTADVEPDIPVPAAGSKLQNGYIPSKGRDSLGFSEACSTSSAHSTYRHGQTSSQRGIPMYSTPLLALRALRRQHEIAAAETLRKIDILIAEQESEMASGIDGDHLS